MTIEAFSTSPSTDTITACVYGPAGTGKTTLASSFPRPILFLDFDGKMATIPEDQREGIFREDLTFKSPDDAVVDWPKFITLWKKIKKKNYVLPTGEKPATIVVDSVTTLDIFCLPFFNAQNGKQPDAKPTLQIYGEQSNFYNSFFAGINSFSCNVVFIFHAHYREDENGVVEGIQPLITGKKMINKIPALFQETWFMEVRKDDRTLHYKPYKKCEANSIRLRGAGKILNPTYKKIKEEMK